MINIKEVPVCVIHSQSKKGKASRKNTLRKQIQSPQ